MASIEALVTRAGRRTIRGDDYIGDAIRYETELFRVQSFDTFELHVSISPSDASRPVKDNKGRWIGWDEYNFEQWGHEPKPLRVGFNRKGYLRVLHLDRWRPITDYLKLLKPAVDWNDATSTPDMMWKRWEQQARWWSANGKSFELLKLPAEVREIIYGHVFGPTVEPHPHAKARRLEHKYHGVRQKPNSNLLLTSKLIHKEASHVLFQFSSFLIRHHRLLHKLSQIPRLRSSVQQLEIALSHDRFVELFHEDDPSSGGIRKASAGQAAGVFRSMNLRRLELVFAAPSFTTTEGRFDGACQKAAVGMIMDLARPYLRGLPVELGGYVKKKQKVQYEDQYLAERHGFETWKRLNVTAGVAEGSLTEYLHEMDDDGGVMLEGDESRIAEKGESADLDAGQRRSLLCKCKVPCMGETWTEEDHDEVEGEVL